MKFRIVFCLFVLLSLGIAPALACTPTQIPTASPVFTPTISDYTQTTSVIFVGTVTTERPATMYGRLYEIQVETYLKGSGYNIVDIYGYGYGYPECRPTISEGSQRIFFVQESSEDIPVYQIIVSYSWDSIALIQSITGQSNPPETLPLDIQVRRRAELIQSISEPSHMPQVLPSDAELSTPNTGKLDLSYIPLSILAIFTGLIALGLSLRLRNRRKPKVKREELL